MRDGRIVIVGEELRHLRSFRLRVGDELLVFDGTGAEYTARLDQIRRRDAGAQILRTTHDEPDDGFRLTVAPAILKGPRMDLLVEKVTELGAARLAPIVTERVVARGDHWERWTRIATAAAKQSGRTSLLEIDHPRPLGERLAEPHPTLRVLAWEEERTTQIDDLPGEGNAALLLTGPEGGFTREEVALARQHGCRTVGLGSRVLRAETAAIVATVLCQRLWADR